MFYRDLMCSSLVWLCSSSEAATGGVIEERCSYKFRNFHRKTPVLESFLKKIAGLRPATLLKKDSSKSFFLVDFAEFLKIPVLQDISW